jgi:nitrogenase molybdenum-iron protein alpha/beta subunit
MDELKHLKRLSLVKSGKNIGFLTPAANPGGHCPMWVSNTLAEKLENLSSLMIGMPECANHSRTFTSRPEGRNGEMHWLYVLDENEVVFGCRAGVIDALREMDAIGTKAILMIATCVTDLIGEDFEGLINEIQPELSARLAFVTLGQFQNFSYQIGSWKTMDAIGSMLEPRPIGAAASEAPASASEAPVSASEAPTGQPTSKTVNVMLIEPFVSEGEVLELPPIVSMLEDRGITVRRLINGVGGAKLEDYLESPDAGLNIVLCAYMQPLAERMEKEFGIPYVSLHTAFSVEETDSAYAEIAAYCGFTWGYEFDEVRQQAIEAETQARQKLAELSFAFLRRVDLPVPLAAYLAQLGMRPELIHIEDFHPQDPIFARRLKELGYDPPACRMMNFDVDILLIRDLGVDLCFGNMNDPVEGIKAVEEMGDFSGMVGYERSAGIINRAIEVFETGTFGGRYGT